jgi:hypothetical protein
MFAALLLQAKARQCVPLSPSSVLKEPEAAGNKEDKGEALRVRSPFPGVTWNRHKKR